MESFDTFSNISNEALFLFRLIGAGVFPRWLWRRFWEIRIICCLFVSNDQAKFVRVVSCPFFCENIWSICLNPYNPRAVRFVTKEHLKQARYNNCVSFGFSGEFGPKTYEFYPDGFDRLRFLLESLRSEVNSWLCVEIRDEILYLLCNQMHTCRILGSEVIRSERSTV